MNLLLVDGTELAADGRLQLEGRRAEHLIQVLGVEPGQPVRYGVIGGCRGVAVVLAVEPEPARVELRTRGEGTSQDAPSQEPPSGPPLVDLILALPRPKALSRVVETAATLGVRHIDLVNGWRVEKSYWATPRLAAEELELALRLGCEQGAHTALPSIALERLLMPYLRERLAPRLAASDVLPVLLHPHTATPLESLSLKPTTRVVLAVGPEGGFIERELTTLSELGFHQVTLGTPVLRTETAVAVALGQLALLRRLQPVHRQP